MPETPDLAAMFLANAKVRLVPSVDAATLNGLLVTTWEKTRAQWPSVKLAPELFVTHLAQRLPTSGPEASIDALLKPLFLEDLYLACACLHDVPMALETFEQHVLRKLPKMLRHRERSAAALDEICQMTRVKLLVSTPEGPPKLAEYKGTGALLSWVQVIALRISTRLISTQKPAPDQDVAAILSALPGPGDAPELAVMKQHHHEELRHAVREAFASLSDDDRYLFRLYYVDRLSMYDLEPLLRVSQPTISRRLKNARDKAYTEIQRCLRDRLGLSQNDFQSFMKLLDSQFDMRLSQILGEAPAPGQPPTDR